MPKKNHSMTDIAPTVSQILKIPAPAEATGTSIMEIADSLSSCEKLAIIAPDALGDFAWQQWQDEMPFLKSLHATHSLTLRSVLPSITPVNFATMVTGTDMNGHDIASREDNFACETLFDVIRNAGSKSAAVGLDNYTGSVLLGRFADMCGNAGKGSDDDVADKILEFVERGAPRLIIAQLGRVDDVFHKFGPSSPLVVPMLRATDARLKRLVERLKPLGYGIIILSDHGQHDIENPTDPNYRGTHGTDSDKDCLVPCTWV
ncbi:alkaline phosphatase family protein [candidate division KSB1 bacterium]|nr:alkaline phosphatase family protein [candidate division KSB1 bacterium]